MNKAPAGGNGQGPASRDHTDYSEAVLASVAPSRQVVNQVDQSGSTLAVVPRRMESDKHFGRHARMLVALAGFADAQRQAWPGVGLLSKRTGIEPRAVRR